ncbi:MAG TPA: hypothetical protein PLR99_06870 [Polyangiaceae bacterium]|jgi:hypothetical protein|nr:hypothetical protein [Polyangiaceae bacterium]
MTRSAATSSLALLALLALGVGGCSHRDERFESVLQLVNRTDVEHNDKGEVDQADFEFEWDPCPGDQFQVVRGGHDFAKCMEKYEKGDYVSVEVKHYWDPHGFYKWDVEKVGDCRRDIEDDSEGSFEKSQECTEHKMYGRESGFDCSRRPFKRLVGICPWMARH